MRRMIVLLMASALMVMVGAAPASAQIIIEPSLAVSEGGWLLCPQRYATHSRAQQGSRGR